MLQSRRPRQSWLTLTGVSVALVLGCSDSAVNSAIHGAPSGTIGAATEIQVAPTSTALNQGGRSILRCAAFDSRGVMLSSAPVWSSSDSGVAIVLSDGSLTARHPGTAVATCQIGGRSATSLVTVSTAHIAFVEVSPGAGTIPSGTTLQLAGVPRDSLGFVVPGSDVQWASADTTIATVSASGVVTARLSGDANIVATSAGVAGMTKVKVTPTPPAPVASIAIAVDQTSLSAGKFTHATATTYDAGGQVLTGRSITWSTSDPTVASVVTLNATRATINALASGSAVVTATSEGKSASATITVGAPTVAIVATSLASPNITVGQTTLASAIPEDGFGNPLSGHTVTWSSLDPSIATVSSSGVVTGVGPGAVIIRATCDGITGDASLTVTAAPVATIATTLGTNPLLPGQTTQAAAVLYDASGNVLTGRSIAWSSLNTAVATVSIAGVVTAVAPGSAVIRATSESKTGDAALVVNAPASTTTTASVLVTFDSVSILIGHSSQGKAVARDAQGNVLSGKTISWTSSTSGIATVSGTGVVTGISAGTPVIKATVDGVVGQGSLPVVSGTTTLGPTASVTVSFDSTSIAVGHMSQAKATARDAQGNVLSGKTASWTPMTPSIASVSASTGLVTGLSVGTASVRATIDGISGTGTIPVTSGSVITSPAPSGSISSDFEDGTFGALFNPWGTGIDVMSDPTGGSHGKVAHIRYSVDAVTQMDDNKALTPQNFTAGLGEDLWFQGDFYIDPAARMDATGPGTVQRKLLYWKWNEISTLPDYFNMVLTTFGPQFVVLNHPWQAFTVAAGTQGAYYIDPAIAHLTAGQWHRLKVHLRSNSSITSKDGVLQIWYDGTLIFDHADMTWTDPTLWGSTPTSNFQWTQFLIGDQINSNTESTTEQRYWDNLIFSKTPIP